MLDIGWTELLVIGIVALIVVGPKDLPLLFRRLGEFTGRARAMAREFSTAMDRAADEAGMKDVQKSLREVTDPRKMGLDALDEAAGDLSRWDGADTAKTTGHTAASGPAERGKAVTGGQDAASQAGAPVAGERAEAAEAIAEGAAGQAAEARPDDPARS